MKTLKVHKAVIVLLVLVSFLSCKEEEDTAVDITTNLLGEWQRSDVTTEFEYKLVFDTENMGYRTVREGDLTGQSTSTALGFEWNTEDSTLIMEYDNETVRTSFSINADGQLLLSDVTDLYFTKL